MFRLLENIIKLEHPPEVDAMPISIRMNKELLSKGSVPKAISNNIGKW